MREGLLINRSKQTQQRRVQLFFYIVTWPHMSRCITIRNTRVMYSGIVCFLSKHRRTIACGRKHFFRSRISGPVRNPCAHGPSRDPREVLGKDVHLKLAHVTWYSILARSTRKKRTCISYSKNCDLFFLFIVALKNQSSNILFYRAIWSYVIFFL